jgi:hypothetical protein
MMKKLAVFAIAILVVFGVYVTVTTKSANTTNNVPGNGEAAGTINPVPASASASTSIVGTLDNALKSGGNFACSFDSQSINTTGKIFVSSNKFRADWQSTTDTHMIYDGSWYYVWGGKSISLKLKPDKKTFAEAVKSTVDTETTSSLSCMPWVFEKEVFELPAGKNFFDASDPQQNPASPAAI